MRTEAAFILNTSQVLRVILIKNNNRVMFKPAKRSGRIKEGGVLNMKEDLDIKFHQK